MNVKFTVTTTTIYLVNTRGLNIYIRISWLEIHTHTKHHIWHIWVHLNSGHGFMRSLCLSCASKLRSTCIRTSATQWCAMNPTHPELAIFLCRHIVNIWDANRAQAASCSDVFLPLKVQQSYPGHVWSTAHGFIASALIRPLCYIGVSLKNTRNCHFCSDKIYRWEKNCLEKCHRA